jgi:hypothetical protein
MSRWHNKFGEGGQRLTILSVLPHATSSQPGQPAEVELSLREAIDEVFRIAGEDGYAHIVLGLNVRREDDVEFTAEENLSLRELADRLYGSFGADGRSDTVLRVLGPGDDPLSTFGPFDPPSTDDDSSRGPLAALRRFREAVHRLFGGSAEAGIPPTVLSLLVNPTDPTGSKTPPADAD